MNIKIFNIFITLSQYIFLKTIYIFLELTDQISCRQTTVLLATSVLENFSYVPTHKTQFVE